MKNAKENFTHQNPDEKNKIEKQIVMICIVCIISVTIFVKSIAIASSNKSERDFKANERKRNKMN